MGKPVTTEMAHAARQVLMNELGLTRDIVRAEMQDIVKKTVEAAVNRLVESGQIARMVADAFDATMRRQTAWGERPTTLKQLVTDEVVKQAKGFVEAHVHFDVKE